MRFFKKKEKSKPGRRVFGFLCDDDLADQVRRLAEIYEVRIYCFLIACLDVMTGTQNVMKCNL